MRDDETAARARQRGADAARAPARPPAPAPGRAAAPRPRAARGGRCAPSPAGTRRSRRPARARAATWRPSATSVTRPMRQRLVGLDRAAGQDQLQRAAGADDARQALRAAVDQRDAPAALGAAEAWRSGLAIRRSHQSASSSPPARQWPLIAAIVGLGEASRVKPSGPPGASASSVSSAFRSAPAQKAPLARAGEDEHVGVVVGAEALEGLEQRRRGGAVDRRCGAQAGRSSRAPPGRGARSGSPAAADVGARACAPSRRPAGAVLALLEPAVAIDSSQHEQREAGDQDEAGVA